MNKHLEQVFNVLLLGLERSGIDYWVYGGVSIAGFIGRFIRENQDVDIFVREVDFDRVKANLNELCAKNNFQLREPVPLLNGRRKLEVIIDRERLSVVPAYIKDQKVILLFKRGAREYPMHLLEKIERNISGYRFFSPTNEYIKLLFLNYLTTSSKKNKDKIKNFDSKYILTPDEYTRMYSSNK